MNTNITSVNFPGTELNVWFSKSIACFMGIVETIDRLCRVIAPDPTTSLEASKVTTRPSRDAVLIIDASPSMEATDWPPSRLAAAQKAAQTYVERLQQEEPASRVAVIAYNREATIACDLTPVSKANKISRAINAIAVGSATNILSGLQAALSILKNKTGLAQLVLLSDGHHTFGPDPSSLGVQLQNKAIVECIGIGGTPRDVDESMLKEIASPRNDGSGQKRYRWIGDQEKLVQHFHNLAGKITR